MANEFGEIERCDWDIVPDDDVVIDNGFCGGEAEPDPLKCEEEWWSRGLLFCVKTKIWN